MKQTARRAVIPTCVILFFDPEEGGDVDVQRTTSTWRYIQEDITVHNHCHENMEFYRYEDYLLQDVTLQDVTPCNLVDNYQSFAGTCCLQLQGRRLHSVSVNTHTTQQAYEERW
jgi:hypothetical protein